MKIVRVTVIVTGVRRIAMVIVMMISIPNPDAIPG